MILNTPKQPWFSSLGHLPTWDNSNYPVLREQSSAVHIPSSWGFYLEPTMNMNENTLIFLGKVRT
jgi:hypothetical protein